MSNKDIQPTDKPSSLKLKKAGDGEPVADHANPGAPGSSAFSTAPGRARATDRQYIITHRLANLALLDRMTEEEARRLVGLHRRRARIASLGKIFTAVLIALAAAGGWLVWQNMQQKEAAPAPLQMAARSFQLNPEAWRRWIGGELEIVVLARDPSDELQGLLAEQETLFLALIQPLQPAGDMDGEFAEMRAALPHPDGSAASDPQRTTVIQEDVFFRYRTTFQQLHETTLGDQLKALRQRMERDIATLGDHQSGGPSLGTKRSPTVGWLKGPLMRHLREWEKLASRLESRGNPRAQHLAAWNEFEADKGPRIPALIAAQVARRLPGNAPFTLAEEELGRVLAYGQFGSRQLYFPVSESLTAGLRLERLPQP